MGHGVMGVGVNENRGQSVGLEDPFTMGSDSVVSQD